MNPGLNVAIVIPAYNEASSIVSVVASARRFGSVVVVDDGSTDETALRATGAGARVISHAANQGYDAVIARGMQEAEHAGADVIITFDADGQIGVGALDAAVNALAEGPAVLVIGVRSSGAARLGEAAFNLYSRLRFGVPDILCGLKGFRTPAYVKHRERTRANSVHTALALALLRDGVPFAVVPVEIAPREGRSRYGGMWRANMRIFRALVSAIVDDLRAGSRGRAKS